MRAEVVRGKLADEEQVPDHNLQQLRSVRHLQHTLEVVCSKLKEEEEEEEEEEDCILFLVCLSCYYM